MNASARQLIHAFEEPQPLHSPLPMWWWSGARLDPDRLRWQMDQLVSGGVRQAVVMNLAPTGPLYGSLADDPLYMSEDWWDIFLGVCRDAQQRDFRLWFYDQFGFSGANFQGALVARDARRAGAVLRRSVARGRRGTTVSVPKGAVGLSAYGLRDGEVVPVSLIAGTARWEGPEEVELAVVYAARRGFDYFSIEACAALIDTVHGEFERRTGDLLGSVIIGSFQDELPDMPNWSPDFQRSFQERYSYDLPPLIHHLWEQTDGAEARQVRLDYHRHRAHLAEAAFFGPLGQWHERHGLQAGFDQQSPAREGDPVGGVDHYADYVSTHRHYSAPGSDHMGDSKLHSSIAHAKGHGRTWIEGFHSTGWGGTLEETYDWFAGFLRRGATLYNPHAVYYATVAGWWEWAPPSTCWRQPYWPAYPQLAHTVSRLTGVLELGAHTCDVAVLYPTATVQSYLTLDGPMGPATKATRAYEALNGFSSLLNEEPGVLDRAKWDYDVLDHSLLGDARIQDGALVVAAERYPNLVLPECAVLEPELADLLVDLAEDGGTVIAVGRPSALTVRGDSSSWTRLTDAVNTGRIRVVDTAEEVPQLLKAGPIRVSVDTPHLRREFDGTHVIALVAHDDRSGTVHPILGEWTMRDVANFDANRFFRELEQNGYGFVPVADRVATVHVSGLPADDVQVWDPRTGQRRRAEPVELGADRWELRVPFSGGSVMLLVIGAGDAADLPPVAEEPATELAALTGSWTMTARSTADNQWGDLADPRHRGVLPLQVWRVEHGVCPDNSDAEPASWEPVLTGTGPFVEVTPLLDELPENPDQATWQEYHYSLSRGIPNDPIHQFTQGPKGMVPEEFLVWGEARRGQWAGVRTTLDLPEDGLTLVLGAAADCQVLVDGVQQAVDGQGYWTASPAGSAGKKTIEIWFRAAEDGPLRASFAVVGDIASYRRPEWLVPGDASVAESSVEWCRSLELLEVPERALLQVGSEGSLTLKVNGVDIVRHGGFDPYATGRVYPRVSVHDVHKHLRPGRNDIVARFDSGPSVAFWLDSALTGADGEVLVTDSTWTCQRDGRTVENALRPGQRRDPRWACLHPRPHPLPWANWIQNTDPEKVVVPVAPDLKLLGHRTEWLRFPAPAGTVAVRLATVARAEIRLDGVWLRPDNSGLVSLPRPLGPGERLVARFAITDGRTGGAVVDGPLEVETGPFEAALAPWKELGLGTLAGQVRYETVVQVDHDGPVVLDLGQVRGTAEVAVNGAVLGMLAWSPYRLDISEALVKGKNSLAVTVSSTLAGYLQDASPTPAVYHGQDHTGLMGPVRLLR